MTGTHRPLLLRNVRVAPGGPIIDLRVADGRVAGAVGPLPGEEVFDAQGGTVLPGLWDSHVHSVQWAVTRRRLDLGGAGSAREAVARVAAAPPPAPGEILVGYGYRDGLWPDRPDKSMLQAALPGLPVMLVSNDLHTAWCSPAALALVGYGEHPTGVLVEQECYRAVAALPPPPADRLDRWVAEATTAAAAHGVVGILDFEFADNVTDWGRRVRDHRVDVRVACSVPRDRLDEAIERGLRTGERVPGSYGLLEVGPVKIFADGSLNTRTAYCVDPYPGMPPGAAAHGLLETPPDRLAEVMAHAARHGLHPAVHAIGDHAATIVLDAFEKLGCPGRIEHAQLLRAEDFARFTLPGLIAGVQPAHAPDDRDVADLHWRGRTGRAFAYAGLLAAGATLEIGSDAPVAPLNPWDGIASAVTRTDDDRPPWHPEQAIPVAAALAAASRGRRSVRAGDPADLVIVPWNPADVPPERLRRTQVLGTLLGGRWTYRADGIPAADQEAGAETRN
ncbi:amidohydrolase family protein [Streptosporangium soli]|nr:amidohydrolase family protein [Streptosporangium sp. KLBMP 9127]